MPMRKHSFYYIPFIPLNSPSDCEYGVVNDMCDENEAAKVKAMLDKAMQRMGEVSNAKESEEQKGGGSSLINMLM